jgi:hypothetical protein
MPCIQQGYLYKNATGGVMKHAFIATIVALALLAACSYQGEFGGAINKTGTIGGNDGQSGTIGDKPPSRDCEKEPGMNCPMYAPPAPGWCSDGVITPRGPDENCCARPPECVREMVPITKEQCEAARGHFNECGSACRTSTDPNAPCTLQCVQYCECGGIAGFGCPDGYTCADYMPPGAADAMGVCKRV